MKQIELQILSSDVHDSKYHNTDDCVITRALQRAGLPYEDCGDCICEVGDFLNELHIDKVQHQALVNKVLGMYSTKDNRDYFISDEYGGRVKLKKLPIEDFVYTLTFYGLE